jgi:hypothetical protein
MTRDRSSDDQAKFSTLSPEYVSRELQLLHHHQFVTDAVLRSIFLLAKSSPPPLKMDGYPWYGGMIKIICKKRNGNIDTIIIHVIPDQR